MSEARACGRILEWSLTALAFVLIIGRTDDFSAGSQIGVFGVRPLEDSSGNRRRLAYLSKGVRCCASCWWKRPKLQHAASREMAQ